MPRTQDVRGENVFDSRDAIARRDELAAERQALDDEITELEEGETDENGEPIVPPCAQVMGCLCAGHAQGNRASSPCDTDERTYTELTRAQAALEEWDSSDEAEELRDLKAFIEEAEGYGDFQHGETCIRDSYFEEYAQEFAEDICEGYRKQSQNWPFTCIDWEKAARELQYDYTSADLAGVTYWFRS